MESIDAAQDRIVKEFRGIGDPLAEYDRLLEYSVRMPPLDDACKTEDALVQGCQSRAWLFVECRDGVFHMRGDSDTLVVRGVISLLCYVFEGRACADVANASVYFLESAGLTATFDSARRSGVGSIVGAVQRFANSQR